MNRLSLSFVLAIGLVAASSLRAEEHDMKQMPQASKELEHVKQLAGTWKGTSDMDGKKGDVVVTYRVTSAGSAVIETMDPGTPHEMVTVFHDEGGKLALTHYCAMGNQPHMTLTKADDKSYALELAKGGIVKAKDAHMHS